MFHGGQVGGKAPFVGREAEMSALQEAFGLTCDGAGSVVLIVGEAGIGKTRLLNEFGDWVQRQGAAILNSTCFEGEASPPFGPWTDAIQEYVSALEPERLEGRLSGVTSEIAALMPELRPLLSASEPPESMSRGDSRARLFAAVRRLVRNCAADQPIVITIDNLQWADRESLRLLLHLAVDLIRSPAMIVGTFRQSELESSVLLTEILPSLAKLTGFYRVVPEELTFEDVKEFVRTAVGEPRADSGLIYKRSQGNPFFMNELLREHLLNPQDQGSSLPDTIRETVRRHVVLADAQTQAVLSAAAVVGRSFTLWELSELGLDLSKASLLDHIRSAQETAIIGPGRRINEYQFTHILFQEYLAQQIPQLEKAQYHKRLAHAITSKHGLGRGPHILSTFRHLSELALTESVEDYPAVTFEAATYSLEIHALEEALVILDTGLANLPADSERGLSIAMLYQLKGIVLFDLRELTAADYFVRAFDAFERLQDYDRAVECAVHPVVTPAALGRMVFWNKIDQGNTDLIRRALAFVAQDSDQYKWLRLYAPLWDEFLQSGHGDVLREFVKEAVETNSPELEAHTRMRLARWYFSVGQHESCRNEERRVKLILEKAGEPKMNRWFLFFSTLHYLTFGKPDEAGQSAREALVLAARSESRESIASSLHIATQVDFVTGDLIACERHARENLDSDHGGPRSLFNEFSLVALMVTAYETGDRDGGDAHKAQLLKDAGDTSSSWLFIAPRMARITGTVDEPDKLLADLQSIPRHPEAKFNWYDMYTQIALAELAVYLSDTQIIAAMVEWFLPLRGSFLPGDVFGRSTDALLAELYEALGMTDEALSHYEDALQFCRLGYLPELAWTSYRYARVLAENDEQSERDRAPLVLDEGFEIAARLNMAPLKELMADLMNSVNHEDTPSPDGLSTREVEVLGLMAEGFTNQEIAERLFISPRTVAQHARNIFQKTGMANRAEATAYAFRHGLAE